MTRELPSGTVTFLFTDIEDSSKLWDADRDAMAIALATHHRLVQAAIEDNGGAIVKDKGDGFFAVFTKALQALLAALAAQRALTEASWPPETGALRVRMAIHTGPIEQTNGDYHGPPVNRVARLEGLAHGEQVVMSQAATVLVQDYLPEAVTLRDLGVQPLRGLDRPEHVFQVVAPGLRHDFPPLRVEQIQGIPLPGYLTSFVGREREMDEIDHLLNGNGHRLVTLLGPGGIGKTRLAVEAGRRIAERFDGGAAFVDLAKVSSADDVGPAIAGAVGAHAEGTASPISLAATRLTEPTLLVIDNFEHVQAAGPAVAELLAIAPRLRCLVTSRSPLRLQGERLLRVDPLAASGALSAAVEMFYDRAAGYGVTLDRNGDQAAAVERICDRVDGLPLAIELVAARVRLLDVTEVADGLVESLAGFGSGSVDLPERQRTIRSTIDWSLQALSQPERDMFARLSVFPAGATLTQIEHVSPGVHDVLGEVAALVDNSLVTVTKGQPGGTRYGQLVPLREYAAELLGDQLDATMARVVDHYVAAAPELGQGLEFGRDAERELNIDHNNLLAAMRWSLEHDRIEDVADTLANLWLYWFNGDLAATAAEWTIRADELAESPLLDWLRGFFGFQTGDGEIAVTRLARAIRSLDADKDAYRIAVAQGFLGVMSEDLGEGRALIEAANAVLDVPQYGLSRFAAKMFATLQAAARGDIAEAIAGRRQLYEMTPALDHVMMTVYAHQNLAAALIANGDLDEARTHNRNALELVIPEHTQEGLASVADLEAVLDWAEGLSARAIRLLGASQKRYETAGTVRWPEAEYLVQTTLSQAREELGEAECDRLLAEGESLAYEEMVELLTSTNGA